MLSETKKAIACNRLKGLVQVHYAAFERGVESSKADGQ